MFGKFVRFLPNIGKTGFRGADAPRPHFLLLTFYFFLGLAIVSAVLAFSNEEVAAARDAYLPPLLAAARASDPALDLLSDAAGAVLDIASLRAFGWNFVPESRSGGVSDWAGSYWMERTFPDLDPSRRYVLSLSDFLLPGGDGGPPRGCGYERAVRSGQPLRAFFRSLGAWQLPSPADPDPDAPPPVAHFFPAPDPAAVPQLRSEIFEAVDEPAKSPLDAILDIASDEPRERMPSNLFGGMNETLWLYAQAAWGAFRSGSKEGVSRLLATLALPVRSPERFPRESAALRSVTHPSPLSELLLLALDGRNALHFLPVFAWVLSQERFLATPWTDFRHFGMIADSCTRFCRTVRGGDEAAPFPPAFPLPSVPHKALALRLALGYLERAVDAANDERQSQHAQGLILRTVSTALTLLADGKGDAPEDERAALRELAGALSRFFLAREEIMGPALGDEEAAARALALHAAGSPAVAARRLEDDLEMRLQRAETSPAGLRPPHILLSRVSWQAHQALVPEPSRKEERWRVAARAWPAGACDVFGGVVSETPFSREAGPAVAPALHLVGGPDFRGMVLAGLFPPRGKRWWWQLANKIYAEMNCCPNGRTAPFEQGGILPFSQLFVAEKVEAPPGGTGAIVRMVLPMGLTPDGKMLPFGAVPLAEEHGGKGKLDNAVGEIRSLACDPLFAAGTARFRLPRGDNLHAFLPFFTADHDKFLKAARMAAYLWLVPSGAKKAKRLAKAAGRAPELRFAPAADADARYSFCGRVLSLDAVPVQFTPFSVRRILLDVGDDLPMPVPMFASGTAVAGSRWLKPGDYIEGEAVLCADFRGFRDTAEAWRKRVARDETGWRVRPRTPEEACEEEMESGQVAYEELVRRLGTANVAVAEPNPWRISFVAREDGARKEYALELVDSPAERTEKAADGVGMLTVCIDKSGPAPRFRFFGFPAPLRGE
jgi:hypothetical protein